MQLEQVGHLSKVGGKTGSSGYSVGQELALAAPLPDSCFAGQEPPVLARARGPMEKLLERRD